MGIFNNRRRVVHLSRSIETEQTVLLSAVTAYMNLLRDAAILELQRSPVDRIPVGDFEVLLGNAAASVAPPEMVDQSGWEAVPFRIAAE